MLIDLDATRKELEFFDMMVARGDLPKDSYVAHVLKTLGEQAQKADPDGTILIQPMEIGSRGTSALRIATFDKATGKEGYPCVFLMVTTLDPNKPEDLTIFSSSGRHMPPVVHLPADRKLFTDAEKMTLVGLVNEGLRSVAPSAPEAKAKLPLAAAPGTPAPGARA